MDTPQLLTGNPLLYINRELSWIRFNRHMLDEALDPGHPLIERVKFLAITASNLDEFATKRVGWLKRVLSSDPLTRTVDGRTIGEQLDLVIDAGHCGREMTTVINLTGVMPELVRAGQGPLAPFGF